MADNARITVDTTQINALFRELDMTDNEPRKAIRAALRDSGNILKRAARGGLSSVSKDGSKAKGISLVVYKNASGCRVSIYNAFIPARGRVFILRWFEEGTKDRRTRKGGKFRGSVAAKPFFERSVNMARSEAENSLQSFIIERIHKIANKSK